MATNYNIKPVANIISIVGESPIWIARGQALYWIDGQQPHLMRLHRPSGEVVTRKLPYRPSCIVPASDGRLLIGYKKGLGLYDFATGVNEPLPCDDVDLTTVSFNDGVCDRQGRFWIGTRHRDANEPQGALYRLDPNGQLTRTVTGLIVSNGIAFSPDGTTMYHTDSRPGRIDAYAYDANAGTITFRQRLLDYAGLGFRPDGCTVDGDGFLWVAEIDGARVARYRPDGTLERTISLPVTKPSSVGFGGPDMHTLYVTTISYGLSEAQRHEQPWAGMLLAIETDFRGLEEPAFTVSARG